jgi:hypothetical protein
MEKNFTYKTRREDEPGTVLIDFCPCLGLGEDAEEEARPPAGGRREFGVQPPQAVPVVLQGAGARQLAQAAAAFHRLF